jgi:acyl-CoA thioesterase
MEFTQNKINQLNDNPLYNTIGIRVEKAAGGKAKARLEPKSKICWPSAGQPHGGILFTFMDTTMAWAVMSQLDSGGSCTTINLNIHYTLPAKGNLFICSAWTTHRSGRVSFVRADINDTEERLIAMGQASFRIIQTDSLTQQN